jgi:Phosphatidylglycerophosphate synthase
MKNRNKNINIPNGLSLLRIILIIPFVYYFMHDEIAPAAAVLVVSGISDLLDGVIARKFNQFTELGQMLDPLSDKLTQGTVAVCLAMKQPVLIPLLAIFVLKEITMVVAACLLIGKKKRPGGSKWYGKVATTMFYISFTVIVALKGIWGIENFAVTVTLLTLTAVLMIYAFVQYAKIYVDIWHSDDPRYIMDMGKVMDKKTK